MIEERENSENLEKLENFKESENLQKLEKKDDIKLKESTSMAPSPPDKGKKRKSSGDPSDENTASVNKNGDIDISEMGPVKGFRDLMRIAKYISENAPVTKKGRKKKKVDGIFKLDKIYTHLKELDKLIGLEDLKDQIAMQIIFFLQELNSGDELMHTAIMGPPGMCKTTVSGIMGKIYADLGFLSEGHVISATRADLVGQYLGETAIKTTMVLEAADGGVLLLDEAYQLGDPQGRDSFASECVNTLNQYLSENTEDFMCIVAGYKDKMYKNFFSMNPGLDRRFPWKFTLKPYSVKNLADIFKYQLDKCGWTYDEETVRIDKYIEHNKDYFKNNGGDTQVFFDKCKMRHAQRIFTEKKFKKKHLTKDDVKNGYEAFKLLKTMGDEDSSRESWQRMYL